MLLILVLAYQQLPDLAPSTALLRALLDSHIDPMVDQK